MVSKRALKEKRFVASFCLGSSVGLFFLLLVLSGCSRTNKESSLLSPQSTCWSCHGSAQSGGAPPPDLSGNSSTSQRTVGAHEAHVLEGEFSEGFDCSECHTKPSSTNDPGHLDQTGTAEVRFDSIASGWGATPTWEPSTGVCSNVYCHGEFEGTDNTGNKSNDPTWTRVGQGQALCGTCHDLPPATLPGKLQIMGPNCSDCHGSVVDSFPRIIDKKKHINGQVDF